ncbi:major facilitator superfamily transporter [Tritrichomonas foetus]|uniref:Major facilitator superfamily transporter n=1 Tax=Tritrichomonas foetus TaxID=1144522 RepID=A0A1J4KMB1_9EUKA|nr:major facilitator superfamily transporter [Tritrichomonas foetus]|eukprot:OHT12363.1 major facilitator superfamily transporter [Tritrichomonas foetus]
MKIPKLKIPIIIGLILMMGGTCTGLTLAYASPSAAYIIEKFKLTSMQNTWFNVSAFICAIVGAVSINAFIPKFGKPVCTFVGTIFYALSFCIIGVAEKFWLLMLFRCINGFTCGFYSTLIPCQLAENSPPGKINLYGYLFQIGLAIGYLLPSLFGFFSDYRQIAFLCMIPPLILVCGSLFIPRIESENVSKVSPFVVFKYPKQLVISFLLMFFLQFSGINALMSNLEPIIINSKIGASPSLIATIANLSQILLTIVSAFIVDKLGNKFCWISSAAAQLLAFILLCLQQKLNLHGAVFMVGLFIEQMGYGFGTGPIPFSLAAQLFPPDVSAVAVGLATGISWVLSSTIVFLWPVMESGMGLGYSFLFFAGVSLLSVIFGIFVVQGKQKNEEKEEKEQSDIDIDSYYNSTSSQESSESTSTSSSTSSKKDSSQNIEV